MAEAVEAAVAMAGPGDAVVLSPACASFDWYRSYAERGDDFARCVRALPGFAPRADRGAAVSPGATLGPGPGPRRDDAGPAAAPLRLVEAGRGAGRGARARPPGAATRSRPARPCSAS